MPITFGCASCGKMMCVSEALAGKSVRCPHCQTVVTAPDEIPVAPVATVQPSPAQPEPESPSEPSRDNPSLAWNKITASEQERGAETKFDWSGFGSGCTLVSVGIWVEFVAVVVLFGFLIYLGMAADANSVRGARGAADAAAAARITLGTSFVFIVVSSVFTTVGRFKAAAVPDATHAVGLVTTSAVFALFRSLLLFAALVMAVLELIDPLSMGGFVWTSRLVALALLLGSLTDLAMVPAMALIGAGADGRRLREAVAQHSLVLLLSTILWCVIVVVAVVARDDPEPVAAGRFGQPPPPARGSSTFLTGSQTSAFVTLIVIIVLYFVYTLFHQAVYQAGRGLARKAARGA